MTFEGAKSYLTNHIMESLKNDFCPAIKAYIEEYNRTRIGKGFFGLLRILFPVVTFLGTLYKGHDYTENAVCFMEDYMGKINSIYQNISDLIYNIYRHGLMHTQMPKVSEIVGKIVRWHITYDNAEHLKINKSNSEITIPISPLRFFQDLIKALESYINDFDNLGKNTKLLRNFHKGFLKMSKVHSESELLSNSKKMKCQKGVCYIKNL